MVTDNNNRHYNQHSCRGLPSGWPNNIKFLKSKRVQSFDCEYVSCLPQCSYSQVLISVDPLHKQWEPYSDQATVETGIDRNTSQGRVEHSGGEQLEALIQIPLLEKWPQSSWALRPTNNGQRQKKSGRTLVGHSWDT